MRPREARVSATLRRRRPSPALVLSALALFFAVGGSAFAIGKAVVPQPKCANGAVRGFAVVTGDPTKGLDNTPQDYSSAPALFGPRFNCTGGIVEVRKLPANDGYEVHFRGITSKVATANVIGDLAGSATVTPMADGGFQVVTAGNQTSGSQNTAGQFNRRLDMQFLIVVY